MPNTQVDKTQYTCVEINQVNIYSMNRVKKYIHVHTSFSCHRSRNMSDYKSDRDTK